MLTYTNPKKEGIRLSVISPIMCLNEENAAMTKKMLEDVRTEMNGRTDIELIVIDNNSTHGQEYMKQHADIYIRLPKNRGWGGGINVGMKLASGEFLLFANNDITIVPGWSTLLFERFESRKKIGTISIHSRAGFSGSFFAIRREVYEKIGDFDEKNFPLGHAQDCDYLYRLMSEGWDDNVIVYEGFRHYGRCTYSQSEFKNQYLSHPNFTESDFVGKWGFREGEWEARGHRDWGEKIKTDPSLDRFEDLKDLSWQ